MSHHHSKIETLNLLLKLLPNYYLHQCPYSYCRCRCHQRRAIQINTISKHKRTSRQVLESGHLTETPKRNVKKEVFKLDTDEQQKN